MKVPMAKKKKSSKVTNTVNDNILGSPFVNVIPDTQNIVTDSYKDSVQSKENVLSNSLIIDNLIGHDTTAGVTSTGTGWTYSIDHNLDKLNKILSIRFYNVVSTFAGLYNFELYINGILLGVVVTPSDVTWFDVTGALYLANVLESATITGKWVQTSGGSHALTLRFVVDSIKTQRTDKGYLL